jgi:hypothetical protein
MDQPSKAASRIKLSMTNDQPRRRLPAKLVTILLTVKDAEVYKKIEKQEPGRHQVISA